MISTSSLVQPRVLIFSGTHGSGYGAERVLEHLLSCRPASVAAVIAPEGSGPAEAAKQYEIPVLTWSSRGNSFRDNLQALRSFRSPSIRANLVHAWHTRGFEWGGALGWRLGLPFTGTLHDDPSSSQLSATRRFLIRTSAHRMKGLVTVSMALEQVCRQSGWTNPRMVIRNGLPNIPPTSEDLPPAAPIRVAFLGLNEGWKGIARVEEVIDLLAPGSVRWELYGEPSTETAPILTRILNRHPDRVCFHHRQSPATIYAQSDVILHPSQRFDPFPTVLLESARAGIPAVASAVGGTGEIIEDGITGILFAPNDARAAATAIGGLAMNRAFRKQLGTAARARYEKRFAVSKMTAAYETFWKACLDSENFCLPPSSRSR